MEALAGFLLGTAAKVGKCLMVPVTTQVGYVYFCARYSASLDDQIRKLENKRSGLQLSVDGANRNAQVIGPDVEDWLRRAGELNDKIDEYRLSVSSVQKGCWVNLKSRYSLGKKAKKMMEVVTLLLSDAVFDRISYPAPLAVIPAQMNDFNSRKSVERSILEALGDDDVRIIGLCGMGGVGKTTMVESIGARVKENGLFDEVVVAVVTQQPELRLLQAEIAGELGLDLKEDSPRTGAKRLCARIKNVRRILVVLDDIWAALDLKELGIPSRNDHPGLKILLTSRQRDVCSAMEVEKILTVQVLSEEEAWTLFNEKAGDIVNSPDVYCIAKEVANECKGLPIALVTVARALKSKSRPIWENALKQLKECIPENIPGLVRYVYKVLELSYSHLDSTEAKYLFLLCCTFQEDFNIYVKDLAAYGLGLGMFARVETVAEAQNRVDSLVDILKDRFLLLQGRDAVHVKMHDVVRDVAIAIASQSSLISHGGNLHQRPLNQSPESVRFMSLTLNAATEVPTSLNFPNLQLLYCHSNDPALSLPEGFFEGRKSLRVVKINQMDISSLESSVQALANLEVLILYACRLEHVSMIGELMNLKILNLHGSNVRELPIEIGKLTKLRVLDVRMCRNLQIIAPGVLSRLVQLEELYMSNSFLAWEVDKEGTERKIAAVTELEALANLTTLKIQVPNQDAISGNIRLCSKLTTFFICIGLKPHRLDKYFGKTMDLSLPTLSPFGKWSQEMIKSSECLHLEGEGIDSAVSELIGNGFGHVKWLHLKNTSTVEYLADNEAANNVSSSNIDIFPVLESFELTDLSGLEVVCRGSPPDGSFSRLRRLKLMRLQRLKQLWTGPAGGSFANLKRIYIFQCPSLKYLLTLSAATSLVHLESIKIIECRAMEEVFTKENVEEGNVPRKIVLPKLSKLMLEELPCLVGFCRSYDKFEFPELEMLKLSHLPKLKGFHIQKRRYSPETLYY